MIELPLLVDAGTLARVNGQPDLRVIDTRWKLGEAEAGRRLFLQNHIPYAIHLDMDADLSAPPGQGGRHPLPSAEAFARTMSRAGVDGNTTVVAYDDGDGMGAARLWWLLRHFGHNRVSVLNGGLPAWVAAGYPTGSGPGDRPSERAFVPHVREGDAIEADELRTRLERRDALLLDARAPERWRGDVEPVDAMPGRIPGSVNAPADDNIREGHLKSASELRQLYGALGIGTNREVVVSCGSGVSACVDILGLELAGFPGAKLYPGSFSGWLARGFPIERG